MKTIVGWTRKLLGTFFAMPKITPLLPLNLAISARQTLSFCSIPSQYAHLDLFDKHIEPIRETKVFKLNDDLTKTYLNQNIVNFREAIDSLLARKAYGLQGIRSEMHDFDVLANHPFAHQLGVVVDIPTDNSFLSFLDQNNSSDVKFDTTHSSIAVYSIKPSFISNSYQEVESDNNISNENVLHSEYFHSADFADNQMNLLDERNDVQMFDFTNTNRNANHHNIVPRL